MVKYISAVIFLSIILNLDSFHSGATLRKKNKSDLQLQDTHNKWAQETFVGPDERIFI